MEHKIWICALIVGVSTTIAYMHSTRSERYIDAAQTLHVVLAILLGGAVSIFTSG